MTKDGETVHNIVYQYDALNRLTAVSNFGDLEATYTYDANGNRATLTYATGTVTTYAYDANNRLTQETKIGTLSGEVTVYEYDLSGNLLQKSNPNGAELYEYNGFNQLVVLKQCGVWLQRFRYPRVQAGGRYLHLLPAGWRRCGGGVRGRVAVRNLHPGF